MHCHGLVMSVCVDHGAFHHICLVKLLFGSNDAFSEHRNGIPKHREFHRTFQSRRSPTSHVYLYGGSANLRRRIDIAPALGQAANHVCTMHASSTSPARVRRTKARAGGVGGASLSGLHLQSSTEREVCFCLVTLYHMFSGPNCANRGMRKAVVRR